MIVFDMDGTLTIVGDRIKYLRRTPKDWDAFYEACGEDRPNKHVFNVFGMMCALDHDVRIVTGRRENTRQKTLDWLLKYDIIFPSHKLYMRADSDYRHDTVIKPELVSEFLDKIEMVFEDRNSMVKKWRELGVTCLQVADGDF